MKAMRIGVNLTAFALVVAFGLGPKQACTADCPDEGIVYSSGCTSLCQEGYCGSHMPIGAIQCDDGVEECNACPTDPNKVKMNCLSFE